MRNSRGLSIIEIMIALGVLSITVVASNQFFSNIMRSDRDVKLRSSRDAVVNHVRSLAQNPAVLYDSSQLNTALRNCIQQDSVNCAAVGEGNAQGFDLCNPTTTASATDCDFVARAARTNPARYTVEGSTRASNGEYQPILAVAAFWATCPDNLTTCDKAETIYLTFAVYPDPNAAGPRSARADFPPYPRGAPTDNAPFVPNAREYAIAINVREIEQAPQLMRQCPDPNQVLIGADAQGQPLCRCQAQFDGVDLDGDGQADDACEPRGNTCPSNTHTVGILRDGRPECQPIRAFCWQENNCRTAIGNLASCNCQRRFGNSREAWIRRARLGRCRVQGGKKGGDTVECENSWATCCVYDQPKWWSW